MMRGQRMPRQRVDRPVAPEVAAAIDRKARVERTQLDPSSWVDVWHRVVVEPDRLYEALVRAADWRQGRTRVEGRWVDSPRLIGTIVETESFPAQVLRRAGLVLEARYRAQFGGFGLLQYRNGSDSIGLHRDRELRFLDDTISVGLSLGAVRPFVLRPRFGGSEHHFMLESGDAYVMGGRCQADWMHGVPKVEAAKPKVSVIWRWTSKRGRPDSEPHNRPDR